MIEIKSQYRNKSEVLQSIKNLNSAHEGLTDLAISTGSSEMFLFAQRELADLIRQRVEQLEDNEENEDRNSKGK